MTITVYKFMRYPVSISYPAKIAALLVVIFLGTLSGGFAQEEATDDESFSTREAINERIAGVRAELAKFPDDSDVEPRESWNRLLAAMEAHLSATDFLVNARDQLEKAKLQASAWSGFPEPPPYSILLVDQIRESRSAQENLGEISKAQLNVLKLERETLQDSLESHLQAERRARELAATASDPEARSAAEQDAKVNEIAARIIIERLGRNQLTVNTMQAKAEASGVLVDLNSRQVNDIGKQIVFTKEELDGIHTEIESERKDVVRQLLKNSRQHAIPDPLLTWRIQFLDLRKSFWNARFTAINSNDPAQARRALADIKTLRKEIDDWVKVSELRLAGGDPETASLDPVELRNAVMQVRAMQRQIGFAISDLEGKSLRERGTPLLDKVSDGLKALWNTELYVVEETDIVDGRKVALYRPITVGKLFRLFVILAIGWWLLNLISRKLKARISRKKTLTEASAELAGKWAFGLGLFGLILYGLHTVSIPLTAFAFLGGALAIGVGFGTQTLLKNFISGIILLFERPLKVGDVVELENITGTIKHIGIRASVIQHFDGIDTLVPNSFLLENQLTNWTFSSSVIRHQLGVGVAYGSSTREVSRLLLAVAESHGLVLKQPAAEVRFDDFGPDSLVFSLLFWLDSSKIGRQQLASDLRFMIDKAFAEAGVTIAYPQRDVHFDSGKPLRVEFSRAGNTRMANASEPPLS